MTILRTYHIKCRHDHDKPATGIYYMPEGCICFKDPVQALCSQHRVKAENNGIDIRLITEINVEEE